MIEYMTPGIFEDMSLYLKSPEYQEKLSLRNLSPDYLAAARQICYLSSQELALRADTLLDKGREALLEKSVPGDFLIPYSGGRDSTLLTYMIRKTFPDRKIHAATVLTGFSKYHKGLYTPRDHVSSILDGLGLDTQSEMFNHYYIDLSETMNRYVLSTAQEDKRELGYPGICSSCKIIIEVAMAQLSQEMNAFNVPYGYVRYQAEQQWPEQTIAYRQTMEALLQKEYPAININSPFWNVMEYPTDSLLMMARLGIPLDGHKGEVSCAAGGLNPISIDGHKLIQFIERKMNSLPGKMLIEIFEQSPILAPTFINQVQTLAIDDSFTENVYKK